MPPPASAMHHGAARIEGYASLPRVREDRGGEDGVEGETNGRRENERAGEREGEKERERLDAIGGFPAAHRSFPYAERPPHRVDRHPLTTRYQTPSTGSTNITSSLHLLPTHPLPPSVLAGRLVLHHRHHHQPPLARNER